jgi:predicted nucleic acid-binding protein
LSQKRRKSRRVVDTSVLVAGVAGMKTSVHESSVANAKFVQRWVEERTFVWLISDEILEEYREVLARLGVRRPLIGKIVNTLRAKGERVKPVYSSSRWVTLFIPFFEMRTAAGTAAG